jgi:hypothetical protein
MIYKRRKVKIDRESEDDDPIGEVVPRWLHLLGCKRGGFYLSATHPKMAVAMAK